MGWQREPGQRPPRRLFDSTSGMMTNGQTANGQTAADGGKVLSVQELNAKRDAIFQKSLEKFQNESQSFHDRYMAEAQARIDLLQSEKDARSREEGIKQELMKKKLEEYEQIGKARKAELKRQEDLLTQKHLRAEEEMKQKIEDERLKEERRKALENEKERQENRAEIMKQHYEKMKVREKQRDKQRESDEMLRQKEMERLQSVIQKEQEQLQNIQKGRTSVPSVPKISVGSRPRDLNAFGFGNVRTGQVTSKKLAFLTRASSVGAEKRDSLNGSTSSSNVRAVSGGPLSPPPKPKHWPLPPGGVNRSTDFSHSTKPLAEGLTRRGHN